MKILLSPIDSYVGRSLYHFLTKILKKKKHEIIGSFLDESNPQFKPNGVLKWISVCFFISIYFYFFFI
jgi:hypothetical protein